MDLRLIEEKEFETKTPGDSGLRQYARIVRCGKD
jgi:hypothetical protein